MQRKKPIIQEKINQETKHIELDKAGDMLVGVQGQMSMAQTVEETMKVQPLQFINKVVDVPVVAHRPPCPREPISDHLLNVSPGLFELDEDRFSKNVRSARKGAAPGPVWG